MRAILISVLFPIGLLAASDPAALSTELRKMEAQIEGGQSAAVLASLPPSWDIDTTQGRYTVSTHPLRELLKESAGGGSKPAKAWIGNLATHLERFSAAREPSPDARRLLDGILARKEFAGIRPPGPWQQMLERIRSWIQRFLLRLLQVTGLNETGGYIIFWVLVACALGAIGFLLVRMWSRNERTGTLALSQQGVRTRTWHEWVHAARQAECESDWRKAIQCAYWAGIARLEETGALMRDRASTPRECLCRLEAADYRAPLSALTGQLERFWYARMTAGAADFADSLKSLEALGCRVE